MKFTFIPELFRQLFSKPYTNLFPVKYAPVSIKETLEKVEKGEIKITPPVEIPDKETFRGKIQYDREKCIGCRLCIKVCPAKAIEFKEEEKKIRIYVGRCIFCGQCVEICPKNALSQGEEFLMADTNKVNENWIVE
ncbi:MAG: 4Fe-4S binding protein [Thermoplasmata archaeon]|nr:4Fe-4S binding protein [Thermoplasmata archaeon]